MQYLNAKNCLLTGATGGLGKELATKLVEYGCNIFLTASNEKKLNELVSLLQKQKMAELPLIKSDSSNQTHAQESSYRWLL